MNFKSDNGVLQTQKLKRVLGIGECTFFGVGVILGAGIYALIGKAAGFSGNMLWLAFLIASVCALLTAFSYAELCSMFPRAGGEFVYAGKAIGSRAGVFLGVFISFNGIISGAAISLGFAGYLSQILPVSLLAGAIIIIVLIFIINASGIRQSSIFNIVFTIVEAAGLVLVVYASAPEIGKVDLTRLPDDNYGHFFIAVALCFYSFIGFEDIVKLAEETRQPESTIPKALFLSTGIVAVIYLLVSIVSVNAVSWEMLKVSDSPLAEVMSAQFGPVSAVIISVIALFSTSNTILTNMVGSSRVIMDMAATHRFTKFLSYISPKFRTPVFALILVSLVMAGFAMIGNITVVALISTLFIFITFLLVNISVIILRIKEPELNRPFRIPLNLGKVPLPALLACLVILFLLSVNIFALVNGGL